MIPIPILIIDDHPLVAGGIAMMLRDVTWLQVACACTNAADALNFLNDNTVDIILLDISLPDTDGLTLCAQIRRIHKAVKIIGLTSINEAGIISQFLAHGGNGYLLKDMGREELLEAIDAVMDNKVFLSKGANQKLLEQFCSTGDALKNAPVLTRREKEILLLLHEGLNGPQIAEKLFLSSYTIETHRKNLMQKLNVSSTQLLLKKAKECRMI